MTKAAKGRGKTTKKPAVFSRDREAVLADFRKIVGPLRGRNRGRTPKA